MKKIKIKKIISKKIFILFGLIFTMFTACIFCFKSYAYAPGENATLVNNNLSCFSNLVLPVDNVYNYATNNNELMIAKKNNTSFNNFSGSFHFDYSSNISLNQDYISYVYIIAFTHKGVDLNFEFSNENESVMDYYYIENQTVNVQYDCYLWRFNANSGEYFNAIDISFDCSSTYNRSILYLFLNTIQFSGNEYPNSAWLKNMFNPYDEDTVYLNREFIEYDDLYTTVYNELYNEFQQQLFDYETTINNQQATINNLQNQVNQLTNSNHVLLQQLANANNDYNLNNLVWSIGGTPFETFKTIWNFEFFGVNISNLIFGLLTGLIVIWIIKKFFL